MGDDPRAEDIVEQGGGRFRLPGWRPSRGASVFAAAALVAGLAAGYVAGDRHARGTAALRTPAATASPSAALAPAATFSFAGSPALVQDTGACSVQQGRQLELGVQVTNQSTVPLTLQTARAVLPMGGLEQVTWYWAPCGALPQSLAGVDQDLSPGASTWLTVTFRVQVGCPAPYPVQFSVGYLAQGHSVAASLPGFPDLGQVPYTGCPPDAAITFTVHVTHSF